MRILVKERGINIKLVFCGSDKGNKRFIKDLIDRNNLNEYIYVFDFLERKETNFLYSKALALVFPTFIGPDNFPPLEAFGLGCPVIASAVPGAEEQIGDNALLFNPFSANDLADKIIYLRGNKPERDKMIKLGFEKAKKWNSNDYARSLLSVADKYRPYSRCYDLKTYKTMYA
jgi:glycosyltransferase involved in cell wall biosynthesis